MLVKSTSHKMPLPQALENEPDDQHMNIDLATRHFPNPNVRNRGYQTSHKIRESLHERHKYLEKSHNIFGLCYFATFSPSLLG